MSDNTKSTEDNEEQTIEEKVQDHIQRRKNAYIKMGTVDSTPDE